MKKFIKVISFALVMIFALALVGCGDGFTQKDANKIVEKRYSFVKVVEEYGSPIEKDLINDKDVFGMDKGTKSGSAIWVNDCKNLDEYNIKYNSGEELEVLTVTFKEDIAVLATFETVEKESQDLETEIVAKVTFWMVLLYVVLGIIAICVQLIVCYTVHEIALSKDRSTIFWTIFAFFGGITILLCIVFIPSLKQAPVYYNANKTTTNNASGSSVPTPKPTPKYVPTWTCPKCGESNNINAKSCIECGASRPDQNTPNEKTKPKAQSSVWKCSKCGETNNGKYCVSCGEAKPKEVSADGLKNTQSGERWICAKCGESNNPAAKSCIECGEPRKN